MTGSENLFHSLGASMVHSVFVQTGAIPPVERFDRTVFKSFFDNFSGQLTFGAGVRWTVKAYGRNVYMYVTIDPNNLYSAWALTTTDEYNNGTGSTVYRLLSSARNLKEQDLQSAVMSTWSKAIRSI